MFKSKSIINTKVDPDTTDTLIGEGSSFEGNIKSEASIRIEGLVNGDIECTGDVTIGPKGKVHSNISARNVIIAGTANGNITTTGKLTLTATGKLYGDISVASLSIEEGSLFEGNSRMGNVEKAMPDQSTAQKEVASAD